MRYVSLFSGIEAATAAWHPLGWQPVAFSEIEPFPRAVLAHHYPDVPLHGDVTAVDWSQYRGRTDVVVGGSPCQAFSIAGLRRGLADPRGHLTLAFLGAVDRIRAEWVVWENVPGVLSIDGGRTFGAFLRALAELGYGWAYRVLDAQYFGVPQRRRRVFVVGCAGGAWQRAAAVLFEPESLRRDSAPGRQARENVAALTATGAGVSGADDNQAVAGHLVPAVANPLTARMHKGVNTTADEGQTMIAHTLRGEGFDAMEDGTGRGTPLVPVGFHNRQDPDVSGDVTHPLGAEDNGLGVYTGMQVRRLTPRECTRLQGFPDEHANIPVRHYNRKRVTRLRPDDMWQEDPNGGWWLMAADGPRYKALGNSMAVPVMAWIGRRIAQVVAL